MPKHAYTNRPSTTAFAVEVGDVVENRSNNPVRISAAAAYADDDAATLPPGGSYRVEAAGNLRARGIGGGGNIIVSKGL